MISIGNPEAAERFYRTEFGYISVSVGVMTRGEKTVFYSSAFWQEFRLFLLLLIRLSQVRALVREPDI